jgi:hypothetical protein
MKTAQKTSLLLFAKPSRHLALAQSQGQNHLKGSTFSSVKQDMNKVVFGKKHKYFQESINIPQNRTEFCEM